MTSSAEALPAASIQPNLEYPNLGCRLCPSWVQVAPHYTNDHHDQGPGRSARYKARHQGVPSWASLGGNRAQRARTRGRAYGGQFRMQRSCGACSWQPQLLVSAIMPLERHPIEGTIPCIES
jgi:hypothetical protein